MFLDELILICMIGIIYFAIGLSVYVLLGDELDSIMLKADALADRDIALIIKSYIYDSWYIKRQYKCLDRKEKFFNTMCWPVVALRLWKRILSAKREYNYWYKY